MNKNIVTRTYKRLPSGVIEMRVYVKNNIPLRDFSQVAHDAYVQTIYDVGPIGISYPHVCSNRAGLHLAFYWTVVEGFDKGVIDNLNKAGWKQCKGN